MTRPRDKKIAEIASSAREKPVEQRAAYLDEICGRDLELRGDVEQLLRSEFVHGAGTDASAQATQAPTQPAVAAQSGGMPHPLHINAYRIVGVLGEGSMGVVYRAEQQKPHRDVALKLLKAGGASEDALNRFEQEAQMLGRLQHPGIAQIFEAGTSDTGYGPQPFFAMELIHGLALNEYAVERALDTRARLELLVKVCDGVEHAHQKGVIHRDLKPGNILVDKSGQPKILDFGIALATDPTTDETLSPRENESLTGTIPYMSLEQVKGKPDEIDTRTDVYALGVIGYQLLSGCLPHDLSRKSIPDAVRIISQDAPRSLGAINKAFRGDLEIIIAKALERQKSSRYQTASALADDLRRYLSNEPILARASSSVYVFKMFAKRNTAIVIGSVAVFLTLVVALIVSIAFSLEAKESRDDARRAGSHANATSDFLFDVFFMTVNPENTEKRVTVLETLDRVAARIQDGTRQIESKDEAAVHLAIGKSYHAAAVPDKAEPHLVRAFQIDRRDWGDEDPQTLEDMNELALLYQDLGKFSEAEVLYRTVLETRQRVLGLEDRKTLETQHNLAQLLDQMGRSAAAERIYRDILEIERRVLPTEDPLTLSTTNALALLLKKTDQLPDAERLYRETLEIQRRILGDDHSDTLLTANNLAVLLKAEDRWSEAETLYRKTLNTRRRVLGDDHPNTLTSMNNLAVVLQKQEKLDDAEALYRETMALLQHKLGAGHPKTLTATKNLATVLREQGRLAGAEQLYRKTLESLRSKAGDYHPSTINAIYSLAVLLVEKGEYAEAEPLLREALGLWREVLPEGHPVIAVGAFKLGEVLLFQGDCGAAEPLLRECLTLRRKRLKPGDWKTANAANALGGCLVRLGHLDEAKPLLLKSYPVLKAKFGQRDGHTTRAVARLARLYEALGEPARAAAYRLLLADPESDPPTKNVGERRSRNQG